MSEPENNAIQPRLTDDLRPVDLRPVKRNEKGHFLPGTKPGPGWAAGGRVHEIRTILFDKISKVDWNKLRKTLVDKALAGDVKAMTLLFSYTLGKPVQSIDVNMTAAQISPEEAQSRIKKFFGLE